MHIKAKSYIISLIICILIVCIAYATPIFAARVILPISPEPSQPAEQPAASMVPQVTQTPRPQPTPWNQYRASFTPTPAPTADPMIQPYIRENVEKAFNSDIAPTPPTASKDRKLSPAQAASQAIAAAEPNFKNLSIARANTQKQIDSLRNAVNLAIRALDMDDRYKELLDAEELWGIKLEEEVQFELEMYRQMNYKELTLDERRDLISVRDMGYERFNLNIKKIDNNIEILKNQLTYAAYAQYAGISKMQAALALQAESSALQKKNLDIAKTKFDLGTVSRVEVEKAELSYAKTQVDIRRQNRSLTSLITGFNKLLGENLSTSYLDFDRERLMPSKRDKKADEYLDSALKNRSEIKIAKEEMDLALRQEKLYETEISHFNTLDDKQDAIQAARESEIEYELAVQKVESEIKSAYKQLITLRGSTVYCESQINTAQDSYDRISKLFELGMTTAINVDQARLSLEQAKMQLENNLIDIWLQQQKLEIISGIGPGGL